jgi:hypothetical protein
MPKWIAFAAQLPSHSCGKKLGEYPQQAATPIVREVTEE